MIFKKVFSYNLQSKFDSILGRIDNRGFTGLSEIPNIRETEWYTESQIIDYQERLLRKLICYVYSEIPYYKKLFRKLKLKPNDIKYIEDLEKIPVLTRDAARENYKQLINPSLVINTHGSSSTTGQALEWAYSKEWADLFWMTLWRGFEWSGLRLNKRLVSFYSPAIGEVARNSLIIRTPFDANKVKSDLELVRKFNPQFSYGYSSSTYIIARYLIEAGKKLPLEGVIVTSDLLYPHYRHVIEDAFECKLYNNYGCNDGGAWGAECDEHSGFHQDFERSIIEFDKDGSMLATDLWNYAMPFIRYKNGDVGKWLDNNCKCGRKMPLFDLVGRINDFIVTPSNKVISPTAMEDFFIDNCFIEWRVIQNSEYDIEILYIKEPEFDVEYCTSKLSPLISVLGDMNININQVDYIERTPSHKRRVIINRSSRTIDQAIQRGVNY